jgi:cytosine/adenosine deaminase-related metal-dependent hydrolase
MGPLVLVCGNVFDGLSDALTGPAEILVERNRITKIERSVGRPPGAQVIDLSERTVSPGFNAPIFRGQGACRAEPRPRIHELRVYDLA